MIALLVAVFPANLHMELQAERYPRIPPVLLWLRLPLQPALIAWVWWATPNMLTMAQSEQGVGLHLTILW